MQKMVWLFLCLIAIQGSYACDVCGGFTGIGAQNPGWYNAGFIGFRSGFVHFNQPESTQNRLNRVYGIDYGYKWKEQTRLLTSLEYADNKSGKRAVSFSTGFTSFLKPIVKEDRVTQWSLTGLVTSPQWWPPVEKRPVYGWSVSGAIGYSMAGKSGMLLSEFRYRAFVRSGNSRLGAYTRYAVTAYQKVFNPEGKTGQFLMGTGLVIEQFGRNISAGYLARNTGGIMLHPILNSAWIKNNITGIIGFGIPVWKRFRDPEGYDALRILNLKVLYKL